jgi:hypothetical protein
MKLNLDNITSKASQKTAERVGGAVELETQVAPDTDEVALVEKKRDFSNLQRISIPKTTKKASKSAAREDNFSNNKNLHHNPGGRPSYYGESRSAHVTVRLRPTLLDMVMSYGEENWNETSRNSIIERMLCKALDVDLKTLEPKS